MGGLRGEVAHQHRSHRPLLAGLPLRRRWLPQPQQQRRPALHRRADEPDLDRGCLYINNNDDLITIGGWPNLTSVGGNVAIGSNTSLEAITISGNAP